MSTQLDIFTHARASDPPTSRAAAQSLDLNARCRAALAAAFRLRLRQANFTDSELAAEVGDDRNIVARRRGDLVEQGLVEPAYCEFEQVTRLGPRGRHEQCWVLTELGYTRGAEVGQ